MFESRIEPQAGLYAVILRHNSEPTLQRLSRFKQYPVVDLSPRALLFYSQA